MIRLDKPMFQIGEVKHDEFDVQSTIQADKLAVNNCKSF